MATTTVLLIEDEPNIVQLLRYNLQQEGYRVISIGNGEDGLRLAEQERPALIVLDLLLPRLSGLEVCRQLKRNAALRPIPILMLTAKASETDKVTGLELGADDYVTKPFSPRELVARVRAILRRREALAPTVRCGALEADWERHRIAIKGHPVQLTPKEFELLKTFLTARGRVLSREVLLETVWGYDQAVDVETRTVDFHVSQLRRKLKAEAHRLRTVPGTGYQFIIEDQAA